MSTVQRLAFAALAVAIVVLAVILVPRDDDKPQTTTATATATVETVATITTGTTTTRASVQPAPERPPLMTPERPRTVRFKKGERIRFRVRDMDGGELHIHGYDKTVQLAPGVIKTVSFDATIEGRFEVEMHSTGALVGRIVVEPR